MRMTPFLCSGRKVIGGGFIMFRLVLDDNVAGPHKGYINGQPEPAD